MVQFARDCGALDNSLTLAKLRRHVMNLVERSNDDDETTGGVDSDRFEAHHQSRSDSDGLSPALLDMAAHPPLPGGGGGVGSVRSGDPHHHGQGVRRPLLSYQSFHKVLNAMANLKYGDEAEVMVGVGVGAGVGVGVGAVDTSSSAMVGGGEHSRKRLQQLILDCLLPLSKGLAAALEQIRRSYGRSFVNLSLEYSSPAKPVLDDDDTTKKDPLDDPMMSMHDLPLPISCNVDLVCVAGVLELLESNEQMTKDLFCMAVASGPSVGADLHDSERQFHVSDANAEHVPKHDDDPTLLSSFQNARVALKTFVEMWEYYGISPRLISRKRLIVIFTGVSCRAFGDAASTLFYSSSSVDRGNAAVAEAPGTKHSGDHDLFEMRRLSERCPPLTLSQFEECVVLVAMQVGHRQRLHKEVTGKTGLTLTLTLSLALNLTLTLALDADNKGNRAELPQLIPQHEVVKKLKALLCEIERSRMKAIFATCCQSRLGCAMPQHTSLFDVELCSSTPAFDALSFVLKDREGIGNVVCQPNDFSLEREIQCRQLPVYCHESTTNTLEAFDPKGQNSSTTKGSQSSPATHFSAVKKPGYPTMGLSHFILALRFLNLISNVFSYSQACLLFFYAARRHPHCWQLRDLEGSGEIEAEMDPHVLAQSNQYGLDYLSFIHCIRVAIGRHTGTHTSSDSLHSLPQRPKELKSYFESSPSAPSSSMRHEHKLRTAVLKMFLSLADYVQRIVSNTGGSTFTNSRDAHAGTQGSVWSEVPTRSKLLLPIITEPVLLLLQTESVALKCIFESFSTQKSGLEGSSDEDSWSHLRIPEEASNAAFSISARDPRYHPLAPVGEGAVLAWERFIELCQHFSILSILLDFRTLTILFLEVCTKRFIPEVRSQDVQQQPSGPKVPASPTSETMNILQDEIDALNAKLAASQEAAASSSSASLTTSSSSAGTEGKASSTGESPTWGAVPQSPATKKRDSHRDGIQAEPPTGQLSMQDCYLTFPQFVEVLLLVAQTAFKTWQPLHAQNSEALLASARLWRLMMLMDNGKHMFKLHHWPPSPSQKWAGVFQSFSSTKPSPPAQHTPPPQHNITCDVSAPRGGLDTLESELLRLLTFERESQLDSIFVYYCGQAFCTCVEEEGGRVIEATPLSCVEDDCMACSQWLALARDTGLTGKLHRVGYESGAASAGSVVAAGKNDGPKVQAHGCSWSDLLAIFDLFAAEKSDPGDKVNGAPLTLNTTLS